MGAGGKERGWSVKQIIVINDVTVAVAGTVNATADPGKPVAAVSGNGAIN